MLRRFAAYYKPHRRLFFADLFFAFLLAVCDLFYPMIAKDIINDYVPNRNLRLLLIWSAVLLGIYLLKAGFNYFVNYYGHIVGVRIQADMRRDVFRRLQRLPFAFFDEHKTGSIMSRIINDSMDIAELAHHGPEDLFLSLVMLAASFGILCTINVPLTLIIFLTLPFIIYFSMRLRRNMKEAFTKSREEIAEINARLENAISGIRVSRAYTGASHEIEKLDEQNQRFVTARSIAYRIMAVFTTGSTLFTDLLYLLVLVAGGAFFFEGWIDAGEFAAYLLYVNSFLNPIKRFVSFFEQYQNGITGFQRFEELMAQQEEPESPEAVDAGTLAGTIDFDHVSFQYGGEAEESAGRDIIRDLSLHIEKGTTVALVGPSGGGKTTLCHLIPRFYEVNSGRILIDGQDITAITRDSLRRNIGMVAQDVFLFTGSIRENIAYGKLDATEEEIVEAAKKAKIHDYILTLPNGYDTYIGERGVKLSGGQKQRISIARVFLKNPSILILDEATSALDNATEMLIQQSLEELARGRTSLIVAHRLSTIKKADEIIVFTDRGIQERGTHEALLAQGGLYAQLYRYQFRD
ncbi:MAG TPA: ABC transporter ATP-binding protein [Candidatus Fimivicinus intestinavium]|nr:ABC transporter ATP-binding protein [Candidatus Fimivicinus intestinavium]